MRYLKFTVFLAFFSLAMLSCDLGTDDVLFSASIRDGWRIQVVGESSYDDPGVMITLRAIPPEGPALKSKVLLAIDNSVYYRTYQRYIVLFGVYQSIDGKIVGIFEARDPSTVLAIVDLNCNVVIPGVDLQSREPDCILQAVQKIRQVAGRSDLVFPFEKIQK